MQEAWEGFEGGNWLNEIDVRDFIQKNYTPYEGDESFLVGPTERTVKLWDDVMSLLLKEREQGGVLDMDTKVVTGILSHKAGYIDAEHPERETIVGLQTDAPLKRALHVNGGMFMG
jgi:formate C-acetyltransferase